MSNSIKISLKAICNRIPIEQIITIKNSKLKDMPKIPVTGHLKADLLLPKNYRLNMQLIRPLDKVLIFLDNNYNLKIRTTL